MQHRRRELPVPRFVQPDNVTCGPTCVSQVAAFFGRGISVPEVADHLARNSDGGTLGVFLGLAALELGFGAAVYPLGVQTFDPTWWTLPKPALIEKLQARAELLGGRDATIIDSYVDLMARGGHVVFAEPGPELLMSIIDRGHPVICGLNATWLYRESRERPEDNVSDDLTGSQVGHFVVVSGHGSGDPLHTDFDIRDPYPGAPFSPDGHYRVDAQRLINAILLGDLTRDAVLLELWPR